jgi:TorA maturation chaperone TorD
VDIQEFVSREKLRGDSFRLLAACFYQPQKDIFQEGLLHDLAESLKELCPDAADYAEEMIILLPEYSDEELLVDYSKLFVGPAELLAAPYGSVYLEKERRLMGDSTMAAIDFYKSRGLVMDADFKEVPDISPWSLSSCITLFLKK